MAMHDTGELAELRRRAYGPDADIDTDPEARQRLQELEVQLRAPETAQSTASEDESSSLSPVREPEMVGAGVEVPSPREPEEQTFSVAPSVRPRRRGVWVSLAAVAIAVVAGGSFWIGRSVAQPQPHLVFSENRADSPGDFGQSEVTQAVADLYGVSPEGSRWQGEYGGLGMWTARTAEGQRCLIITAETQDSSVSIFGGIWNVQCARTFDPVVEFPAGSMFGPDNTQFDNVELIRFVSRPDGVALFIDPTGDDQADGGRLDIDVLTGF